MNLPPRMPKPLRKADEMQRIPSAGQCFWDN